LTVWGYTLTNNFGLQNPFSTYGNPQEREVESHGVLAGYWTPGGTTGNANSERFLWSGEGQLCSFGGGHTVMWNCLNSDPTALQSNWQSVSGRWSRLRAGHRLHRRTHQPPPACAVAAGLPRS
jgi:hypothetical protein